MARDSFEPSPSPAERLRLKESDRRPAVEMAWLRAVARAITWRRAAVGLVAGTVLLSGAHWYWLEWTGPYAEQIRQLRYADIDAQVTAALAAGDRRHVGVMEDGLDTPGAPDGTWQRAVRVIPNTSDCPGSPQEICLQEVATQYAEAYNQVLRRRLGE